MIDFLTDPVPHEEARAAIAGKPAVARDVFDGLPDELKGRAFTISGIEDFDTLEAVRAELAELPAGADWDKTKHEIVARISPWFTPEGAEARAETLMRHHAFAGYEGMVTMVAELDKALFNPMWQQVRASAPWEAGADAG